MVPGGVAGANRQGIGAVFVDRKLELVKFKAMWA